MVIAAELIRQKTGNKYGTTPISIGFWVGGGVTPNSFDDLKEDPEDPGKARRNCNLLYKQLLTCPFCGKPLSSDNFYIDFERKTVEVYCSDSNCMFYKYKQNRMPIPVYLVDEEIYSRCPSIILSTVDKFARLPWDVKTNALFGRVNRLCSRDGYVAIGDDHKRHPKTADLPTSSLTPVKSFAPPELIIQDELHLITGPLGTVYGAYETIIEDLCTYTENGRTVRPKYVVSTATIPLTELMCKRDGIEFIESIENGTRIRFAVYEYDESKKGEDLDENLRLKSVVPFQLAYAVSIHKAQGLEYDSVKVIIPSNNAEKITHGIFYTAITRAKTNLKIYWSSETMHDVVTGFATDESKRKSLEIVKTKLGKN